MLKFHADTEKRLLAWRPVRAGSLQDMKGTRKINLNKFGGGICMVPRLLESIRWKPGDALKDLEVKAHKSLLEDEIYYVDLKK